MLFTFAGLKVLFTIFSLENMLGSVDTLKAYYFPERDALSTIFCCSLSVVDLLLKGRGMVDVISTMHIQKEPHQYDTRELSLEKKKKGCIFWQLVDGAKYNTREISQCYKNVFASHD